MDEKGEPVRKKKRLSKEKSLDILPKTDYNEKEVEVNNEEIDAEEDDNKTEVKTLSFDPQSLRKRLRDDSALQAVKILLSAADNAGGDAIKDYINAGGGPLELLQVINNPDKKKNPIFAGPVFSAVQLVVVKILSDFPLLQKSAEEACCYLLSEFMPTIHFMLIPSASINHKMIALKLLTSVASLSTQLARDVLNSINLEYSHVEHLAAQVKPYDNRSVRVTFIHFILSFIVDGNSYIIRQLLQNKGLLRLLMQDLIFDNSKTVIFLLTALKDKVVSSQMIPKSLKIHCFNTAVLIYLLELYNWLGPKHWVSKKSIGENRTAIIFKGDEEERNSVRECVHSLLILLCTSHKFGIAFSDRDIGTGPSCLNVIIRSLFKAIEKQWEDDLVKELVRSILLVNPDLISSAFSALKKLFEPRSTKNWLSTVQFISQVTEQLDPKLCLPDHLSNQQIIRLVKNLCLPSPVMQTIYSKESLNNEAIVVRSAAVKCLLTSMKSLFVFISYTKFSKVIVSAVVKHLKQVGPKLDYIISAWKMGSSSNDESSSLKVLTDVDYNLCFVELLLILYKISPLLLDSTDALSDGLIIALLNNCFKESDDQQKMNLFKLETLKMVSVLKTLSPIDETFKTCVKLLTELMTTDLRLEAKTVLENLLLSSRLLEGVEDEVEIWLHCLVRNGSSTSLIDFFQEVIKEGALNTAYYFKVINDACSGVSQRVGKSTSNIDDIIAILEEDDDNDVDEEKDVMSISKRNNLFRNQQSLSPLVPAMLHIISNKKFQKYGHDEVELSAKQNFVTSVLVHSLHRQTYPERLQRLLQKDLVGSATAAFSYISSWTESGSSPHPLTFTPFSSNSIELKISKFFLQQGKSSKLANEILHLLEDFSEDNPKLLLHMCVFYITQLFQRDYLVSEVVEKSAKIISKILSLIKCSSQSLIPILEGILTHPVIVSMFQPMKKDLYPDLVQIVLLFINAANSSIKDKNVLNGVLFECKKKLLNSIIRTLKKQKPLKTDVSLILQEFPLTEEDIQSVLSYLINLPIDIQVDGWFETEALLLNKAAESSIVLLEDSFSVLSYQMTQVNGGPDCLLQAFKSYVCRFPHFIKFIETDLFITLLNESNSNKLELAKLLLQRNKKLVDVFKDNIVDESSLLFPLLSVIDCKEFDQKLLNNLISKQVNFIKEAIFNQPLWFTQHSTFIASLLEKHLEKKLKKKLFTDIKSQWNEVPRRVSVLELLKSIVPDGSDVVDFVAKLLVWLTEALDNSSFDEYIWLYDGISDIVSSKRMETNWRQLLELENFNNVMRTCLKWGLRQDKTCGECLMKILVALSKAIFSDDDKDRVAEFFNLVISHSDFISIMIDNNDVTYQVVELLLILLKINHKLTMSSHVPIYLSAYGATMSKTDQKILELLQLYENSGSSVWEWRPCLWGPTAANFYSVHSKSVQPLWRQPRMSQVLDLLDKDLIDITIRKFPLKRSLQADVHIIIEEGAKIYDPAFILPLLTHLLAEGADVQHRSMVNSGALAIVLASLGSSCIDLRSVGYLVLTRFHSHLSSGENDQQLWLNFINAIRGGVLELQQEYPQIATIIATFLAQASLVLSLPQHPLFTVLHNFLLAKPALNLTSIPAFLELLQSKDVQHREHQEWILKVLRDGTRQKIDMKLLFQSLAFKILMTLYSFVHTPKELRILIIEIFTSCIAIQDAGYVLVTNYGLISWMSHCLMSNDYDEVSSLINFLEKLSYFKSCSLHIKLIAIYLASNVSTVSDIEIILKILSDNKVIGYLNQDDVRTVINMVMSQLGTNVVRKSNDMMKYGCDYVMDVSDSNKTVCALNKLVHDWLCKS